MHEWATTLGDFLAAVSATPSPVQTVDPVLVTPGPAGFVAIAVVALAAVALVWDMQRRIRRTRYREEVNADLDAEEAAIAQARDADRASATDGPSSDTGADDADRRPRT